MKWDVFAAELSDTRRGSKDARVKRPCVYCGTPTKALSQVCLAHDDLVELDPGYPSPAALRRRLRMRRIDRLARVLTERELAYLSRAIFRQRVDRPDDEPKLAAQLDPLVSVARSRAGRRQQEQS